MLLSQFISEKIQTDHIIFEYGYFGRGGAFMRDEQLSFTGTKEELLMFLQNTGSLRFCYACSGECNDFEVCTEGDDARLRYIDFR